MGIFQKELANVIEWNETREGVFFYKWPNQVIKKGSKLIVRPGQDAIFMYNGKVEGIFEDEGSFDIESDIIPFLTTLKSFKFAFNTPMRAEVLFINTKEMLVKWGTKNAINLRVDSLPGGMPIRAFGTFACKIAEHAVVIDKLAGIRSTYTVDDVKERITAVLDQLLMSWIGKEGHDMFNLQADAAKIAKGIQDDLDMDMRSIGIAITDFVIESFNYPEEVAKMQQKMAAQSMIGDVNRYQQVAVADAMEKGVGGKGGSSVASDMVSLQMGMAMGQQMVNQMQMNNNNNNISAASVNNGTSGGGVPNFCPNCGQKTEGKNFCGNCGQKLN